MAFTVPRHPTRVLALLLSISGCLTSVGCSAVDSGDALADSADGHEPEGDDRGDAAEGGGDDGGDGDDGGGTGDQGDDEGDEGGDSDDSGPVPDDGIDPDPAGACNPEASSQFTIRARQTTSMASPVHVREAILAGSRDLGRVSLRTQEFFNYYRWGYTRPSHDDDRVRVHVDFYQGSEDPSDEYLLQIGVTARDSASSRRSGVALTLVIDNSLGMAGKPFDRLKETCRALAASLNEGDRVSIVGWSGQPLLSGHEVDGPNAAALLSAIESLELGKEGSLSQALDGGYAVAIGSFSPDRINRVVLISDGDEIESDFDIDLIEQAATLEPDGGIHLVGVGVGVVENYDSGLMERLARWGRGASVFVGSADEAWTMFNDRFMSTLFVAIRDLQLTVTLPDGFNLISFDEDNPMPVTPAPQDLAPGDSLVVMHRVRTCAPELVEGGTITVQAEDGGGSLAFPVTEPIIELLENPSAELTKGLVLLSYDALLKAQKTDSSSDDLIQRALDRLEQAENRLPDDPDLAEIRAVVEALAY